MTRREPPALPIYLDPPALSALAEALGSGSADSPTAALGAIQAAGGSLIRSLVDAEDVAKTEVGELVVADGDLFGNPLLPLLDFVATMLPLVEPAADPRPAARATPAKARAAAPEATPEMARRVLAGAVEAARADLRSHALVDVVMVTAGGLAVVGSFDRALLGPPAEGRLQDCRARVYGKVTQVIGVGDSLNLFRRSCLAATAPEASREILAELAASGLELDLTDPVVDGPAVEILPLAVLI